MKLVIVGGSAASTPALIDWLARQPGLAPIHVVLAGRTPEHLAAVLRASRLCTGDAAVTIQATSAEPRLLGTALQNADLVLVQTRDGGLAGRHVDETFPMAYGLCGDEGLGPGGLSAAWRAWPALEDLLGLIAAACPRAIVLLLTSPPGLLARAAAAEYRSLRLYGICEVPWAALQEIGLTLHLPADEIEFDYLGVNHCGWLHALRFAGRPLLPLLVRARAESTRFPSGRWIARCGAWPTRYLRMHYEPGAVLEEQRAQHESRAQQLARLSADVFTVLGRGDLPAIRAALARRPTPWYAKAVGPFIAGCAGSRATPPLFLSCRNDGWYPGFADDDVLECPHVVARGKVCRRPVAHLAGREIEHEVDRFVRYETAAAAAVVSRDPDRLAGALQRHPWIARADIVPALVSHITSAPSGVLMTG